MGRSTRRATRAPHHITTNGAGSWTLLTGDSVHCFGDGVPIASAFVVDWPGWWLRCRLLAHELPHHVGDLVALSHRMAAHGAAESVAGWLVTALGGPGGLLGAGRVGT